MTNRQKKCIKHYSNYKDKETYLNLAKSMRKAQYKDSTSKSGTQYRTLRKYTSKIDYFDPDVIKRDIMYVYRQAKKLKDITNLSRNVEHRSKIAQMVIDKSENKTRLYSHPSRKTN
jgi:hypothetical protein